MSDKNLQSNDNRRNRNEWIVVYIAHNIPEAHIVAGRLKHEGIPAYVDHMAGRDAIGITFGNMGEVRVLVHPENYETALDLLDDESDELPDLTQDENTIYLDDWDAGEDDD